MIFHEMSGMGERQNDLADRDAWNWAGGTTWRTATPRLGWENDLADRKS
jgi:hypothetical protein